jgi:uncharacterized coiled-coil protein SlyX
MRGYARNAFVGILMVGLIAVPTLSPATDRDGNRHSLIQQPNKHAVEHHQHNLPQFIETLQNEVAGLKTALAAANTQLSGLTTRLKALETGTGPAPSTPPTNPVLADLAKYVKVDPGVVNGLKGPHVIFSGVNVHVESGSGTTVEPAPTGLGNLVVGYNEMPMATGGSRNGSHNLVVGPSNAFASTGGAVFGSNNAISGPFATILGGKNNLSDGQSASILGGYGVTVHGTEETYP